VALGGSYDAVAGTTGEAAVVPNTINTSFINLPAVGQGGFTPASFAISLFSASANRFLNLELSALEADGKGKLVSSPRVVTADQTKALIEQGTEFPYQQATSSGATSVAFRKATLKLEVTPQITPEGNIILDLDINKDSRGETTAAGIAIDTKHIKTQVLVENGGTVVIGGIFELTENETVSKVPFLGDIPIAGNLFKNTNRNTSKQEMLVFITPKMISDRAAVR
jgi:type IV pilus assembly protein PilQ